MEFVAKGRLTLEDVRFFITADHIEDAKYLAAQGYFDRYEVSTEVADASIQLKTVKENR